MKISVISASLFAATVVGLAAYFSDIADPVLAGFIASVPVALPAMLFFTFENNYEFSSYAWSFALGITAYFIAAMCFYYLYDKHSQSKSQSIAISMVVWIVLCYVFWRFLSRKVKHNRK